MAWSVLKSKIVEKQMYYLSATAVQPEVSEEIFKTEVFIPIPKGENEQQRIFDVVKDIEQKRQSANIAIDTQDNSLIKYLGITI